MALPLPGRWPGRYPGRFNALPVPVPGMSGGGPWVQFNAADPAMDASMSPSVVAMDLAATKSVRQMFAGLAARGYSFS